MPLLNQQATPCTAQKMPDETKEVVVESEVMD
jgi:hypothetical protein